MLEYGHFEFGMDVENKSAEEGTDHIKISKHCLFKFIETIWSSKCTKK